jgi:hypothetical protein
MDWEFDDSYGPAYDVAQICLNGHVINDCSRTSSVLNQEHCEKCGEPTRTNCQSCGSDIRGRLLGPGVIHGQFLAPRYCWKCGHSYPWTERRLQAAKDLADEFDELDEADRTKLKASLDDLVKDSPATEVAGRRFKKIVAKLGKESAGAIKSVIIDVLSETAKKVLVQ